MDLLAEVRRLLAAGAIDRAAHLLASIGTGHPDTHEGWTLVSNARREANDLEGALDAIDRALWADNSVMDGWLRRADLLTQLNRLEAALAACSSAVQCSPYSPVAYLHYGWAFERLDQAQQALWAYDQSLSLDNTSIDALLGKGRILLMMGLFPQAQSVATRIVEIDARIVPAWRLLAVTLIVQPSSDYLIRKRSYEEAERAIDQALAIDPDDSDTLFVKAGILDDTGRKRQARQLLKQAATIDPGNELVQWATQYSMQQRNQRIATNTLHYGGGIAAVVGVGLWETLKAVVDPDGHLK